MSLPKVIEVNIVNKSNNELPSYANPGDAGCDVRAFLSESITIQPGARALIPTGLYFEIPLGYEIQVRPRSGLALKYGITIGCDPEVIKHLMKLDSDNFSSEDAIMVLNNPGTIDSYYRGELGIILINTGKEPFTINTGDRVAQLVVSEIRTIKWNLVTELNMDNDRGGGFGSSKIS